MGIRLLVLTSLLFFLGSTPAFAVSFTISNPQQINDEITIDASLSELTYPNVSCYIQAAFTAPTPIRYFGFTKNNSGQWYKYINSPTTEYIQSTFFAFQPINGSWSGQITLKIKSESPYYNGPGTYNIKAWRYTGNSSNYAGDPATLTVNIEGTTASPSSTPTPSSSQTPTPTPSTSPSSSFTIANIPPEINSDQSFNVSVNLTLPNNRNTDYYLGGAFKKTDGTRYFGLTKINSSWIKYESSNFLNQYKIATDDNGNWTGTLEVKPDTSDTDYKGTGDYIFKVSRYTANGSQTWSNESTIKIISTENSQGETSTTTPTPKANPSTSPSAKTKTTSSQSKSYDRLVYHSASVAGAKASASTSASALPEVSVKNQKQINPIIWIGLVLILIGVGSLGYIYLKKNGKIPF